MDRKIKNTLFLVALMGGILVFGYAFILIFQKPGIKRRNKEMVELTKYKYDTQELTRRLNEKHRQAEVLDSVLAARKFNIPKNLSPLRFYDFVNKNSILLSPECRVNVEYLEQKPEKNFFTYLYKVTGVGTYNDVYQLIYFIEQSRELKKIVKIELTNFVESKEMEDPQYLVSYNLTVAVYFSDNDRFMATENNENNLRAERLYDIFYPIVRTQIPPNYDHLLDVQGARLLALVPEGAFLSDMKGESYLLMEGDKVYLGYMTQIDRRNNRAKFILNKGGIVESVEITLEKEIPKSVK